MRLSVENHELLGIFIKDFIIKSCRRKQGEIIGGFSTILNSQRQPKYPKYSLQAIQIPKPAKGSPRILSSNLNSKGSQALNLCLLGFKWTQSPQRFSLAIRVLEAAKQLKEEHTQYFFTWSQVNSITPKILSRFEFQR